MGLGTMEAMVRSRGHMIKKRELNRGCLLISVRTVSKDE